jgi:SAM-dependent methyltransferase
MTEEASQRQTGIVRSFARAILWPFRRFFDPRFQGVAAQIAVTHENHARRLDEIGHRLSDTAGHTNEQLARLDSVVAELDRLARTEVEAATDATTLIGEALAEVSRAGNETLELVREIRDGEAAAYVKRLTEGTVDDLDAPAARLLNYAESHQGFAAQRNLWFNPAVSLAYEDEDVSVGAVNERIVELPYVLRALAGVRPGGNVLDVGATESLVSLCLASLGYDVTAVDPRPYPLSHPRLKVVTAEVQRWEPDETFDAVVCLSTIEHIGLGAYGDEVDDERADLAAMRRIRELTAPQGLLVLTTPFGSSSSQGDGFTRVYDRASLDELLAGWEVADLTIARRESLTNWVAGDEPPADDAEAVALVTARRAEQ